MSKILPFKIKSKKTTAGQDKHINRNNQKKRKTVGSSGAALCANNHHKWAVNKAQRFDTIKGKLVTVESCERCGRQRNRLT